MTENSFLADTSFLIDLEDGRLEAVELLERENITTGALCIFELQKLGSNESIEEIGKKWIHDLTVEDADKAAEIHRKISNRDQNINTIDCLIAAQAINRGKILLTADTDFQKIKELETKYYRETR